MTTTKRPPFTFLILFTLSTTLIHISTATADSTAARKLVEEDQNKCGGCPCTSPCVVPTLPPPSPPPPSPSPPPPALPPPPPRRVYPPPTTAYCPPPPSTYIYITGPPGNLYPVDPNYSGSTTIGKSSSFISGFVLVVAVLNLIMQFW